MVKGSTPAVLFERLLFAIGATLIVVAALQAGITYMPSMPLLGDDANDDLNGAYVSASAVTGAATFVCGEAQL